MTTPLPKEYLAKARSETWVNFSILRHGAFDGFLVTSKNSGTHWMMYMLSVALADSYGIERPKYYSENALRPYIGFPTDKPVYPQLPRLARSHTIPHRLADWDWARRLAGLPNYVLGIRHPMAILASHHAKWEYDIQVSWLDYLKGDPGGARFRCDLYWLARFWNRWGEIEAAYPETILKVQYEETQRNPRATLEAIAAHWGIALTPEAIKAALFAGTKEEMAKKADPDGEPNVLQNRKQSLAELFTGEAMDIYTAHIRTLFRHDLGYDLLTPPA
ncbi:hypothetical protein HNE_0131 [Hyphomonas neptunium ATCC 15444]|uniref:Sulfotransferase family protein n=1 Tax=Hyphomonas neptunium (strain ATCC 15444) TaxID=228405 RepID=Q0C5X8_HYPNA|nr:sulfotransferase family protein [Hyphomonas neptunium]ABI75807.1 hypothetical protein HNE_0131 [Hyphomonas neptunium ATCC 15444]